MEEKRKSKRMPVALTLEILNMYKQDNIQVGNLHAPIEVVDISKTGIGFKSESVLPLGYYFNANINLDDDDTLHCVVQIVRSHLMEKNVTMYGCEFIGMANVLSYIFDEYDKSISEDN